jgi:mannose-6-phosphate isomerase-like protein (cupin superfamily)
MPERRYKIVNTRSLPAVPCPCGSARRAFVDETEKVASLHVVNISRDARVHYHKRTTEIYYILEGEGQIELDGMRFDVSPGSSIMIKPGCRHRAIGDVKLLNIPIPAFDPEDEWFDNESTH